MDTNTDKPSGVNLFVMLTILFIGLKLTNYIDWPWYCVLMPLWLPIFIVLIICMILALLYCVFVIYEIFKIK